MTAIKLSESNEADTKFFPELVEAIAENFDINEVTADKAYLSKKNFQVVANAGGTAYIPFKSHVIGK